jgi:hypothetical protein
MVISKMVAAPWGGARFTDFLTEQRGQVDGLFIEEHL